MTLPDLFLLRHGQSVWNRDGRVQGQTDVPLTDQGYAQAAHQGRILASLGLAAGTGAITSPLERARETARVACGAAGLTATLDDRLMEMALGPWEGRLKSDLRADLPDLAHRSLLDLALDGVGEGPVALRARCQAVLDGIDRPMVIVSHGITLTMMRALVLGLDRAAMVRLDRPQGVVIHIAQGRERIIDTPR